MMNAEGGSTIEFTEVSSIAAENSNVHQASQIELVSLKFKLLLPLRIQSANVPPPAVSDGAKLQSLADRTQLQQWEKLLTDPKESDWVTCGEPYPYLQKYTDFPGRLRVFQEKAYLHRMMRSLLYPNRDDKRRATRDQANGKSVLENQNLLILSHRKLNGQKATLTADYLLNGLSGSEEHSARFDVDYCQLSLFDSHVAIVELGLSLSGGTIYRKNQQTHSPATLQDLLALQDMLRRTYPAYWLYDSSRQQICKTSVVRKLELCCGQDKVPSLSGVGPCNESSEDGRENLEVVNRQLKSMETDCEPRLNEIWEYLLKPMRQVQTTAALGILQYEQIQDDRCPVMVFAVTSPKQLRNVSVGDWARVAMQFPPDDSAILPLSPEFCGDEPMLGRNYDRYWYHGKKLGYDKMQHRWLCSAVSFCGIADQEDGHHPEAAAHFDTLYRNQFLISLVQRASLLAIKEQLSECVEDLRQDAEDVGKRRIFKTRIMQLRLQLVRFRCLYWSPELTNQEQGQELYELLRKHQNQDSLFSGLKDDVEQACALVSEQVEERRAEAADVLAVVGVIFLLLGLLIPAIEDILNKTMYWGLSGGVLLMGAIGCVVFWFLPELLRDLRLRAADAIRRPERFRSPLLMWAFLLILLFAWMILKAGADNRPLSDNHESGDANSVPSAMQSE